MTVSNLHLRFAALILLSAAIFSLLIIAGPLSAHDVGDLPHQGHPPLHAQEVMRAFSEDHQQAQALASQSLTPCIGGFAGSYPCNNVDLLAFLPLNQIGGGNGNDIWGWTDSQTGNEYAIMGRSSGTSFVDISDPINPVYLGNLPPFSGNSSWRDIKVYNNHAFIVTEASNSGMQVFDLSQLRNLTNPPITFSESAHYNGFQTAHNIVINEQSGFAYAVGTNMGNCGRGLHMINIQDPLNPTSAGCYSGDGYTHDAQCVIYSGPDADHQGQEICFNSNEDTLTIVDVTNKSNPIMLSRTGYPHAHYTHQGWLTEDQAHFLLDDELDEQNHGFGTHTFIWDMADLDSPVLIGDYTGATPAIDHNQYVLGNYTYQANYRAGLRILDISDVANANLSEVAYFDIYPSSDSANFNGAWSNFPYFDSGVVIVSGIEQGLFILRPNLGSTTSPPSVNIANPAEGATVSGSVPIEISASDSQDSPGSLTVEWRVDDGAWQSATFNGPNGIYEATWDASQAAPGPHIIYAQATDSDSETGSDSNNVTIPSGAQEFHVESINVVAVQDRGPWYLGRATVTIVDDIGSPVSGVSVNGSFLVDWSGPASGATGSNGQVILETPTVKNGVNWLFCVDSAAKSGWTYDSAINESRCGGTTAVGEISGRITEAGTGIGIQNAVVSTGGGQSDTADSQGYYILDLVPIGQQTVTASAGGYVALQQTVNVAEGAATTANFVLDEENSGDGGVGSIKGTITDSSGAKLAGVTVTTTSNHSAVTNRGGKYTIQNVPAGPQTVTASKGGYLDGVEDIVVNAGATTTVNFMLTPAQ